MAGVGLFLVTVVVVLGQGTSTTTEPRSTLDWQRTSGTDYWRYLTSRAAGTYPWRYQTSAMPPSTLDWQRTSGTDYWRYLTSRAAGTDYWRYPTSTAAEKESTADWRYQSSSSYTNCGTRSYYSTSGSVSSPNYPSAYPDNAHCEWVIEPGTSVYLKVTDLQLESCCDHLQIYDQYGNLFRNDSSLNELYGGYFRVVFTSDGSKSSRGFQIHWNRDYPSSEWSYWTTDVYTERTSTQDWRYVRTSPSYCGTRNYHSIYGTLSSPNYPMNYPDNANCDYVIDPGTYVYLTLTDFDLQTCCDHLVIYDAGGRKMSFYLNDPMYSNRFRVVFTTDGSIVHKGFQLHWSREMPTISTGYYSQHVSHLGLSTERYNTDYTTQGYLGSTRATYPSDCGGDYIADYVVLESPGYPGYYPHYAHCVYTINSPVDVQLDVEKLNLADYRDTLSITRDYESVNPTLDRRLSVNDSITGRHFRLEFNSDYYHSYPEGFRIVVHPLTSGYGGSTTDSWRSTSPDNLSQSTPGSMTCGGTYRAREGVIESPNYPGNYPDNVDCWYHIYAGTEVVLDVERYDLESGYDFLYLLDDQGSREWSISGSGYSGSFTKSGAHFQLEFTTDSSQSRRGFRLTWKPATRNTSPGWWGQTTNWWRQTTDSWMRQTSDRWGWATTAGSQWPYSTDSANGIRVNCNSRDLSVAVPRDVIRQVFPSASVYDLTLNNPNCKGQVYPDVVMFSSSILGCGMTREETRYEVVYQNRIRPWRRSPSTSSYNWYATSEAAITRFDSTDIKVECRLDNYATAVGFYRPKHNHELVARGHGNFSAYMDFYHDYNYNYKITSYPISLALNEDVFVDLRLDTGDPTLKITAQTCYASSSSDPYTYYSNRYTLISNGCPADPTVALEYSPAQHVHFRFRSFEFLKDKDHVYIFCQVNVCNDTDYYNRCHQNCNTRHRRDAVETEDHDFKIFQGPLKFRNERSTDFHAAEKGKKDSTLSGSVPAIAMAVSAVAMVIAAVVMVITRTRRQNRSPANNEDRVI